MSTDGQGTKWLRNIAKNFNRLSRAHERYSRQTDGRQHIANVNSHLLKNQWLCIASSRTLNCDGDTIFRGAYLWWRGHIFDFHQTVI